MYTNLYKVTNLHHLEPLKVKATIILNPAHEIFSGHFPNEPLMPGVCIMDMIKKITSGVIGKDLFLRNAKNVKFIAKVGPALTPEFNLDISYVNTEDGKIQVNSSVYRDEVIYFRFAGVFELSQGPFCE